MKGRTIMHQLYKERVFSGLLAVLPAVFAIVLLGMFVYYQISGPLEEEISAWFFLGMGLFFLVITINFAFLTITISPLGVSARFGVINHTVPLNNIAESYQDKTSSVSYGGFGIRFGWVNGKRRLIYNTINTPRVVLQQLREPNQEFVFSTRQPEKVIQAIKEALGTR
jgi:hypothetical protein